jgi:hypothetical protein
MSCRVLWNHFRFISIFGRNSDFRITNSLLSLYTDFGIITMPYGNSKATSTAVAVAVVVAVATPTATPTAAGLVRR